DLPADYAPGGVRRQPAGARPAEPAGPGGAGRAAKREEGPRRRGLDLRRRGRGRGAPAGTAPPDPRPAIGPPIKKKGRLSEAPLSFGCARSSALGDDILQFLRNLEDGHAARRHRHRLTRPGVAGEAGLPVLDFEGPESANLDVLA